MYPALELELKKPDDEVDGSADVSEYILCDKDECKILERGFESIEARVSGCESEKTDPCSCGGIGGAPSELLLSRNENCGAIKVIEGG